MTVRRFTSRLALAGASILVTLLLGELALRAVGWQWSLAPEKIQFGWPESLAELDDRYRPDPDLFWVRRDHEAALRAAQGRRPELVALGDSCTEFSDYPRRLLQQISDAHGVPLTGLALGNAGWSSYQGLRRLERDVLPLHPAIVTFYFGWNDHWLAMGREDAQMAQLVSLAGSRWNRLRLVQLVTKARVGLRAREADPRALRVPLPQFRDNLRRAARESRAAGTLLVLITAPSNHVRGAEPEFLRDRFVRHMGHLVPLHRSYVEAVREVARQERTDLCDLAAEIHALPREDRDALFRDDGIHFSGAGSRRVARMLFRCLDRSGALVDLPADRTTRRSPAAKAG